MVGIDVPSRTHEPRNRIDLSMLPAEEEKLLKEFLALAKNPEETFTYDELLGFLFGLAMTPEAVPFEEWLPCIFGGKEPAFRSAKQAAEVSDCLARIYSRQVESFRARKLEFPIDIGSLGEDRLITVYEWVSGLDEALTLRAPLWEPEFFPRLNKTRKEELYFSLMIIEGLVEPDQVMDFFERLPDEFLQETLPGLGAESMDRDMQVQIFLLATLPLAIRTLQDHARTIEKKRRGGDKPVQLSLLKPAARRPDPSSCGGCGSAGQPNSCCESGADKKKADIKKSNVIKVDFPQHKKKARQKVPTYQLKVTLEGARPPIWRRILVPGDLNLSQLHKVIQLCMGWTDSHLHQFLIDRTMYSLPDEDDLLLPKKPKNEAKFTLQALDAKTRGGFQYIYDFGDDWLHRITVEKVHEPGQGKPFPVLVAGRRACPPEDIGGIHGYHHLLEILADPDSAEYREHRDWLGEDFDPDRFGKEEISLINMVLEDIYS